MGCCGEGCCKGECCCGRSQCYSLYGACNCGQGCCCRKGCKSSTKSGCCPGECCKSDNCCQCGSCSDGCCKCDSCGCCGDVCGKCGCCGDSCCSCGVCGECCKCCACCGPTGCLGKRKRSKKPQKGEPNNFSSNLTHSSKKGSENDSEFIQHLGSVDVEVKMPVQEDVVISRAEKCKSCCKKFVAFLFSTVGLTCLMVAYTIFGGFIFMKLEAPNEINLKHNIHHQRRLHAQRLWDVTSRLNILYPDNWTRLAENILAEYTDVVYRATKRDGWDGRDGEKELQWTFAGSMLYSITVITTIGYGHIAPKTDWGRLVTILYAVLGIPLTLLTITNLGGFMASAFRFIYKNICCGVCCLCCQIYEQRAKLRRAGIKYQFAGGSTSDTSKSPERTLPESPRKSKKKQRNGEDKSDVQVHWRSGLQRILKTEDNQTVSVPIYVSLLVLISYVLLGAVLFALWEDDWDYLIGSYFCFITLTTIGFGDYVPGTDVDSWANQQKLVLCSFYLLLGLSLIAMCFDLMQEEARNKFRALGRKLGILEKD